MAFKLVLLLILASILGCRDSGESSLREQKEPSYHYFAYIINYNDNTISSFAVDEKTGALSNIEVVIAGNGGNPITLTADKDGNKIYVGKVVDFHNGHSNLQVFSVNHKNGSLSPFEGIRVEATSTGLITNYSVNSILLTHNNLAYVSVNNEMRAYSISDFTGRLVPGNTYGLGGPSATSFLHPNRKILIWGTIGGVTLWPIDEMTGEIIHKGAASSMGLAPPLVLMNASGTLMFNSDYRSSRLSTINVYAIEEDKKKISHKKSAVTIYDYVSGGDISPNNKLVLISQREKNLISSFSLNSDTGDLTLLNSASTESYPTKVKFLQNGKFALVLNKFGNSISSYSVDEDSGHLKLVSRANTGKDPQDLIIIKVEK